MYLSQESDSGGTFVPSQLGYHEAATTSESLANRDLEICRAFDGVCCANAKGTIASNKCRIFVIMTDRERIGREWNFATFSEALERRNGMTEIQPLFINGVV